jgi:hypothetical protein
MNTTRNPTNDRDEELGAALRELSVPEHTAAFHHELRRRLADERGAARGRFRVNWKITLAAAAVAAAGAAAVAIIVALPTTNVATAAVVQGHLRTALTTMQNLSGVLVDDGPARGDEQRWRFTLDAAGDVRLEGPGRGEVITYDVSTGIARSAQTSASIGGSTLFYAERHGIAPGPPDQGPPTWVLPGEFASYVRAALAAGNPDVREVTYRGAPAWRLDVDTIPNAVAPELSADRFEITVDRLTGLPVRIVETKQGAFLRELRIEDVAVNKKLAPNTFTLRFPTGADVARSDDGFRYVPLRAVGDSVGYAPLVPQRVPDGYRLAEVAVARVGGPTGREAGNPPSRMVVSLSYRRGLDQFLVTTRLRGAGTWEDPLATGEGFVDNPETLRIDSGELRGASAQLLIAPRGIPHVWALTSTLVVTVSGDLTRPELIRVANSLHEGGSR